MVLRKGWHIVWKSAACVNNWGLHPVSGMNFAADFMQSKMRLFRRRFMVWG